jgi:hypothetical protein
MENTSRYTNKDLTYRENSQGGFDIIRNIDYRGRPLTNKIAFTGFENVAQEIVEAVNKADHQASCIADLVEVLESSLPVIAALARGDKPDQWVMRRIEQSMVDAIAKTKEQTVNA